MTTKDRIVYFCEKLKNLLLCKNEAYGDAISSPPILLPGMSARHCVMIRMSDKIRRLSTLQSGEISDNGETEEDTVFDIAGYSILWLCIKQAEREQERAFCDKVERDCDGQDDASPRPLSVVEAVRGHLRDIIADIDAGVEEIE